jgi:hypothetical protein
MAMILDCFVTEYSYNFRCPVSCSLIIQLQAHPFRRLFQLLHSKFRALRQLHLPLPFNLIHHLMLPPLLQLSRFLVLLHVGIFKCGDGMS